MAEITTGFRGNNFLRRLNEQIEYTEEMLDEKEKCADDPLYFIETYAKIISLDKGVIQFKMFPYQRKIIETLTTERKVLGKVGRQLGKCQSHNMKFTVRNKKTGEILEVTAEEFHNLTKLN